MPEFQVGDIVRVEMPRGYNTRGVLGISLLFSTSPEAKFEGAIGTVTQINPVGTHTVHQYLVDFRTHDNSRVGIPWQAQWFREEWLALKERPESVAAEAVKTGPEATWPTKPEAEAAAGGIAHPGAKIYTEGRADFAPPGMDPSSATGTVPDSAYGVASPAATGEVASNVSPEEVEQLRTDPHAEMPWPDARASDGGTSSATPGPGYATESELNVIGSLPGDSTILEQGEGYVRVQGVTECPPGYPIKGNESSGIYHTEGMASYARTVPEICFISEEAAVANGYRAPRGGRRALSAHEAGASAGEETSDAFGGPEAGYDRSAANTSTFEPTLEIKTGTIESTTPTSAAASFNDSAMISGELIMEQGDGFVRVQGMSICPDGFPIKGNASSGIYHRPTDSSYQRTIPEVCFATEEAAIANGYRAPGQRKS
jgi:hypothetical protein